MFLAFFLFSDSNIVLINVDYVYIIYLFCTESHIMYVINRHNARPGGVPCKDIGLASNSQLNAADSYTVGYVAPNSLGSQFPNFGWPSLVVPKLSEALMTYCSSSVQLCRSCA